MFKNPFKKSSEAATEASWIVINAPLCGQVIPVSSIDDPVFAQLMVGDGVGILPTSDEVLAPVSGTLTQLFRTGHAAGITTPEGLEVLVHVGLDTVELNGEGFTTLAEQGQQVVAGQPLIKLDLQKLGETARSLQTPLIVTNMAKVKEMQKRDDANVSAGEWVLKVRMDDARG